MRAGIKLLNATQDVYLSDAVTIAVIILIENDPFV